MKDGYGFGFTRDERGKLKRKPNNFGVKIGKDVEVGLYTCIDKGSYRDTVIGEGTKLDNLIHVGHNAIIGKHCLIVAGSVIGGSVEIGDYTFIGMNVSIKEHVKIGKNCIIGAGSVVLNDVPSGQVWVGNPARYLKENESCY